MESLFVEHALPAPSGPVALRRRVGDWLSAADDRLHEAGSGGPDRVALAAALREGMALAAEELRAEEEARHDGLLRAEVALDSCRRILDALPVALLVTDLDGRLREANAVALRLLGLSPVRGVGTLLVRHVPLDEHPAFRQTVAAAAADARDAGTRETEGWRGAARDEPSPREIPLRLRTPDGTTAVLATVRGSATGGERLLYWAVREDLRADVGDLL